MSKKVTHQRENIESILSDSLVYYSILAAVGLMIVHFSHQGINGLFTWQVEGFSPIELGVVSCLGLGILLVLQYFWEAQFPSFQVYRAILAGVVGRLPFWSAIVLAIVSALAEEIFFRSGLQPFFGLVITAIGFALLHIGPSGQFGPWTVLACLSGLLLGWMYQSTGTLWPSVIAHSGLNLFAIFSYRSTYQDKVSAELSKEDAG